ncbi:MAG TPA: NAD-dependent epimerase/dehydratase family protein, partial [Ilumatobacteraceae bacterium]
MTRARGVTVVGAAGLVGRRVVRALESDGLDVRRIDTRTSTLSVGDGDVVVLALPAPHAPIAAEVGARGASVVSVVDDLDDTCELLELDDAFVANDASLVVGAGLAPGLSGLVARYLADQLDQVDEIHVAVHATAGPACARQHHRALRGT